MDTGTAHHARVYDYLLGGVGSFAVDRAAAERGAAVLPGGLDRLRAIVRAERAFLGAVVRYMAGEAGLLQFLDIGTGIPNPDSMHTVAQETAPDARIVYVDDDPVVLAYAHALRCSTRQGATHYVHADPSDLPRILAHAATSLDLNRPVGIVLVGTLHRIRGDEARSIVARLIDAVPAGSHLAVSHLASDVQPELVEAIRRTNETMSRPFVLRSRGDLTRLLDGLALLQPGIVTVDTWHPPTAPAPEPRGCPIPAHCALARRP